MEELKVKVVEVSQEKEQPQVTIIFVLPLKLTDEK